VTRNLNTSTSDSIIAVNILSVRDERGARASSIRSDLTGDIISRHTCNARRLIADIITTSHTPPMQRSRVYLHYNLLLRIHHPRTITYLSR